MDRKSKSLILKVENLRF